MPLSFWQDFLRVCESLWWREDWKTLSDEEWQAFVNRKVGGLARLERFLVGNPRNFSAVKANCEGPCNANDFVDRAEVDLEVRP